MSRIITVKDPKTGEEDTTEYPDGFAATVICDDTHYLDGIVKYANGTFVLTIKRIPEGAS